MTPNVRKCDFLKSKLIYDLHWVTIYFTMYKTEVMFLKICCYLCPCTHGSYSEDQFRFKFLLFVKINCECFDMFLGNTLSQFSEGSK